MIGLSVFFFSYARHSFRLAGLPRIDDKVWLQSVKAAARSMGIRRKIVTLEADSSCPPDVVGAFVPRPLAARDWRSWSTQQRSCILLHELAHIRRGDISTQMLGRMALLVYWFHPLIWNAVRQLRVERELATDNCVLMGGQTASDYAEELLYTLRSYRPVGTEMGVAMANSARLDQRVLAILDPQRRRSPVGSRFGAVVLLFVLSICFALGGATLGPRAASVEAAEGESAVPMEVWKENYTIEYRRALPVSVAFSPDGKTLLTGDTSGELMLLVFQGDSASWRWKAKFGGSHAAVAFSADAKRVYATTEHGTEIFDVARGKSVASVEEKGSNRSRTIIPTGPMPPADARPR